ncbi:MAG: TfoX/Sxy family protein, partial [Casimicrobiaceae bacterium]
LAVSPPGDNFARISELFAAFGPIAVRRMFGGAGIYADGKMFGLLDDDVIYLKADEASAPAFQREGSTPFVYVKDGRPMTMSYWRLPERLYDDPDELAQWARAALALAQRKAATKPAKRSGRRNT